MKPSTDRESGLCFLKASRVDGPTGDLGGLQLHGQSDETLGMLNGILIDPAARRVRYFVLETPGWFRSRKYLISTECLAKVERNALRLEIHADDLSSLDEFDSRSVRDYCEEDAVEAMFTRQVA